MSAFFERLRGAIPVSSSALDNEPVLFWLSVCVCESSSVTLMLKKRRKDYSLSVALFKLGLRKWAGRGKKSRLLGYKSDNCFSFKSPKSLSPYS